MKTARIGWGLLVAVLWISGCAGFGKVTDTGDPKVYYLVGRVQDSFELPVEDCQIYLTKLRPGSVSGRGLVERMPVALTDRSGNYHFAFEIGDSADSIAQFSDFWVHFDATDQGYLPRRVYLAPLLESSLFQYTGNNPLIVNVIMPHNVTALRQFPEITQPRAVPQNPPQESRGSDEKYCPDPNDKDCDRRGL